jgi:hypothetical protein
MPSQGRQPSAGLDPVLPVYDSWRVGELASWHLPRHLPAKRHPTEQTIASLPFAIGKVGDPFSEGRLSGKRRWTCDRAVCVRRRNAIKNQGHPPLLAIFSGFRPWDPFPFQAPGCPQSRPQSSGSAAPARSTARVCHPSSTPGCLPGAVASDPSTRAGGGVSWQQREFSAEWPPIAPKSRREENPRLQIVCPPAGGVAERPIAPVLKTGMA